MNRIIKYSTLTLATLILSTGCSQSTKNIKKDPVIKHQSKHWGYTGEIAPIHWGELHTDFRTCSEGKEQSPIDVNATKDTSLPRLKLSYTKPARGLINNGHTVQVNIEDGNTLTIDGYPYTLKQFHFHTPSENHIKGKSFPLEAHFVHITPKGRIAVVAVMFEEGAANAALNRIVKSFPLTHNKEKKIDLPSQYVNVMLPIDTSYYQFMGSLTTPPCSEGVKWFVIKKTLTASKEQIDAIHKEIGMKNNRPIQPTNGRIIKE
jgi:carbonic anhydrase